MGWADNIKRKLNQDAMQAVNDKIIDEAIVLGTLLVANSPEKPEAEYAKGLFKNSWYVAVNEFDPTVGTQADMSGAGSLARIASLKGTNWFAQRDGFISFTNNLDYAFRVEFAGWPQGEGENGWVWSGRVGAYAPVRNSVIAYKAYLKK